jgi:hypothetical protein
MLPPRFEPWCGASQPVTFTTSTVKPLIGFLCAGYTDPQLWHVPLPCCWASIKPSHVVDSSSSPDIKNSDFDNKLMYNRENIHHHRYKNICTKYPNPFHFQYPLLPLAKKWIKRNHIISIAFITKIITCKQKISMMR